MFLALLATLAVGLATEANMNSQKASNLVQAQDVRLQAESAVAYFSYVLRNLSLPGGLSGQEMLDALAAALGARLNGTANLGGQTVAYDGSTITVPLIAVDPSGAGFSAAVTLQDASTVRVVFTGQEGGYTRRVRMDFRFSPGGSAAFDYGVASRSKIVMTGNPRILGASDPAEASVLSATYSDPEAVKLTGNCTIDGDLSMSNPDAHASLTGNISIGGEGLGGDIVEHIQVGVGDVEFPEADPSVFEPFATNIVDRSTRTNGNRTFTNIRILAGTNPTFSGNITIKGVVFIETPNRVRFSGNLNITGVVVTEDAGDGDLGNNYIHFTGNTSTQGVENLPDTPEFQGLKQLPGTFLLAPGFSVKFTGNFGTINGAMGCDQFQFTGNAGGTVTGPIINWSDTAFTMTGNAHLTIDRSGGSGAPPGFSSGGGFEPLPETYTEL